MKRTKERVFAALIIASMISSAMAIPNIVHADTTSTSTSTTVATHRLAGLDRYATAIAITQKGWTSADAVVIASGETFADALVAGPLASKYKAPILLSSKDRVSSATLAEITTLGAKNVIIIGGTGVLSSGIEAQLTKAGITSSSITRFGGANRYETSVLVAKQLVTPIQAIVASGEDFPDALSISAIASKLNIPIILTAKEGLSDVAKTYINSINPASTYIVGGTGAISSVVEGEVLNPIRLSGVNRYDTNLAIIKQFKTQIDFSEIYLATGENYADALSGTELAALTGSSIFLVDKALTADEVAFLKTVATANTTVIALGGTAIVSDAVLTEVTKDAVTTTPNTTSLTAYNAALAAVTQANYTSASWTAYQVIVAANVETIANTQAEVDAATLAITAAQKNLATSTTTSSGGSSSGGTTSSSNSTSTTTDTTITDLNSATTLVAKDYTITSDSATYGPASGTTTVNGNVTVTDENGTSLTLQNMNITGTLAINYGAGNVVLDNVIANGVNVSNVGSNSLHIRGNTVITSLIINDANNDAHIVVEGNASVTHASVLSGANIEVATSATNANAFSAVTVSPALASAIISFNGAFGAIVVNNAATGSVITLGSTSTVGSVSINSPITISGTGTVTNIILASAGANLTLQGANVGTLTVNSAATGSTVSTTAATTIATLNANSAINIIGTGAITTANLGVSGSTIETAPTHLAVVSGVTATVGGEIRDFSNSTIITSVPTPTPASVSAITVTNLNSFKVVFSQAPVDPSKVTFTVLNGTIPVTAVLTWNSTKTEATLTSSSNLPAATYTIDVKNGTANLRTTSVIVSKQKIANINITSTKLAVSIINTAPSQITQIGYISYKVLDQYGNDITDSSLANNLAFESSVGTIASSHGLIKLVPNSDVILMALSTLVINGYDSTSEVSVSATLSIPNHPGTLSDIQLGATLTNVDNKVLTAGDTTNIFYLPYTALDISGNSTTNYDLVKNGLITDINSNLISSSPYVTAQIVQDPNDSRKAVIKVVTTSDVIAYDMPVIITALNMFTGEHSQFNVTLKKQAALDAFTLQTPAADIHTNEEMQIPFTAYDQNGVQLTKYADLVTGLTLNNAYLIRNADGNAEVLAGPDGTGFTIEGTQEISALVNSSGKRSVITLNVQKAPGATTGSAITISSSDTRIFIDTNVNEILVPVDTTVAKLKNDLTVTTGCAITVLDDNNSGVEITDGSVSITTASAIRVKAYNTSDSENSVSYKVAIYDPTVYLDSNAWLTLLYDGINGASQISYDSENSLITLDLSEGSLVTGITPTFQLGTGATIERITTGGALTADVNVPTDFTNPQQYVVTAQNGATHDWTIRVRVYDRSILKTLATSNPDIILNIEDGFTNKNLPCAVVVPVGTTVQDILDSVTVGTGAAISVSTNNSNVTANSTVSIYTNGSYMLRVTNSVGIPWTGYYSIYTYVPDGTTITTRTIESAAAPTPVSFPSGTLDQDMLTAFPSTVTVTLSDNTIMELPVNWSAPSDSVHPLADGIYQYTGALTGVLLSALVIGSNFSIPNLSVTVATK